MKNKKIKIVTVILLLMTLTLTNFLFVGSSLIAYAQNNDNIATNHQNVEFDAYFKDTEDNETKTLKKEVNDYSDLFMYLKISVKKEGYFNGEVLLENSNFILKESPENSNEYINKIEDNKITLNQINAGETSQVKVKIEPVRKEMIPLNNLEANSNLTINGIYRDSTEKDITIQSSRQITFALSENNQEENVLNNLEVITNKIMKIDGEEKRVIQLSWDMGLKENNYPIKEIVSRINIPKINEQSPEIIHARNLNNMNSYDYKYEDDKVTFTLKNEPSNDQNIMWKEQGNENIILTCIYPKDANVENIELSAEEQVTLYNEKQLTSLSNFTLNNEEKDSIIEIESISQESSIYKGKLYSNIDRTYNSTTNLQINLAKAIDDIEINEEESKYIINEQELSANVFYNQTIISKEQFDKLFGENGVLTIYNENDEQIGIITNGTNPDANGNLVINYEGKEPKAIKIRTTAPVEQGNLVINHTKVIKAAQNRRTIQNATEILTKITANYNIQNPNLTKGNIKETTSNINLQETKTEAKLELNKNTLSTIVANDIEMKVTLISNDEQYDLYKNPEITINLPEQVENITINSVNLIYEDELKIASYYVEGNSIKILLEGEQTSYKEKAVEGANIVINATLQINRKSVSKDETINMTYQNENAATYQDGQDIGTINQTIKIVAPTDVTTINSIKDLDVETIGQEQTKQVMLNRGSNAREVQSQIEIINNNQEPITNAKILGTFPTNSSVNNMGITLLEGITLQGIENAKIYYTENENATNDINNTENGWNENFGEVENAKKFLIIIDQMEAQSSVQGTYKMQIPANLEYNQIAKTVYEINYSNSVTRVNNSLTSTSIELQTGTGPIADIKLIPTVGGNEEGQTVKTGEVIKYKMEISNTGTEDINNLTVKSQVPEGTKMVEAEPNYEYTGSSYYKELENTSFEETIESLKVGEVIVKEYEVRVNQDLQSGTQITNKAQLEYQDVKKESNETKNTVEAGNLRVSVKRITDRNIDLYTLGNVQYFAIIENTSATRQENVKVETNIKENMQVDGLSLITGLEHIDVSDDDIVRPGEPTNESSEKKDVTVDDLIIEKENTIETEELEYSQEVDIGSIEPGEVKVLSYEITINKPQDGVDKIDFSVKVKDNSNKEYRSNKWEDQINHFEIALNMIDNSKDSYIKSGDVLEYTINVENKSNSKTVGLVIKDDIPDALTINKVTVDGQELEKGEGNNLEIYLTVQANSTSTIKIETVVNYSEARDEVEPITNVAYAQVLGETIATTPEITHMIEPDTQDVPGTGDGGQDGEDNGNEGENGGDVAEGQRSITGLAWFDENANGQKDNGETAISNVKVRLLNAGTNNLVKDKNGNIIEAVTNENGVYVLDKIANGKYIVIFDYDTSVYGLTKYQAQGVSESVNSDAMKNQITIENETKEVASTDIIEVQDNNVSNISIGLIKLQNFDLKLDKYVSKIIIQTNQGTTVKEYNNETLAKAEIDAKQLNGANVVIEYKIDITNVGEVEGYVRKVADYIPQGLDFSSQMNTDWYMQGDTLYNATLANEKIAAGETKTLTLTLTKAMTEDNLGRINNRAEIAEAYNELGLEDSNSTPANKARRRKRLRFSRYNLKY